MILVLVGVLKWWYPKNYPLKSPTAIDRIFHYKQSILGYPHLWKPPFILHAQDGSALRRSSPCLTLRDPERPACAGVTRLEGCAVKGAAAVEQVLADGAVA
jgi:hypothetical protein